MEKLDRKFDGVIFKTKDMSVVPPDQYVVFLAKDNAFPDTLRFYRDKCHELGAQPDQLRAINDMIRRVEEWRLNNVRSCKVPDVEPGELLL